MKVLSNLSLAASIPLMLLGTLIALLMTGCAHNAMENAQSQRKGLLQLDSDTQRKTASQEEFALQNSCSLPSSLHIEKLLSLAAPENFQGTRYRKGPRSNRIEKETDCSRFVHEIYHRAGLEYRYRSSRDLKNASEFEKLSESEARAGDLMLFRGHVGIVDKDGFIISATRRHSRKQRSAITRQPKENFPGIRGKRIVLRYKCQDHMQVSARSDFF